MLGNHGMAKELSRILAGHYQESAPSYRELWAPVLLRLGEELLAALPAMQPRHVADVGAGVGLLLPALQRLFPQALVIGADLAPGMLRLAPRSFPCIASDATHLPFPAGSFDVLTLAFVLFHLPSPVAGLLEARRVLRPGGILGTATWGRDPGFPAARIWSEELERLGAVDPADPLDRDDEMDTPEKVEALMFRAGLRTLKAWTGICCHPSSRDEFMRRNLSLGSRKRRLDSLHPSARRLFLQRVQKRLASLGGEDFTLRRPGVFAVATGQ